MTRLAPALLIAALVCIQKPVASQSQRAPGSQTPTFRSSVDLTMLDVSVVQSDGRPVGDLRPGDFTVRIDGKPRRVVSAEWVSETRSATTPMPLAPPDGYSSNEAATPGRLIVVAIDQPNIRADGAAALRSGVNAFIDRLEPSDRVAAVALGGTVSTPFMTDRARIKDAIGRMRGDMQPVTHIAGSSLTASEAVEITEGSLTTLEAVVLRECERGRPANSCPEQIESDARAIALQLRQGTHRTLISLQGLLDRLRNIEAPKTLVMVSEGFVLVSQSQAVLALGSLAAAARTSIYGLRLDDRPLDMGTSRRAPYGPSDRQLRVSGFDLLASISKGGVFDVVAEGGSALQHLERELSGFYLVGVESAPLDADGKGHPVNVRVGRRGTVVRARRDLAEPGVAKPSAPTQIELVAAALSSPLVTPGLPLRVATFSVRDQDPSKVQVLIHADIGSAYTSAAAITLGYVISDHDGTAILSKVGAGEIAPLDGIAGALPYLGTVILAPGEYLLKLAATEGGRVGSVEHPIHAGLIDAGPLKLSELLIGGSGDATEYSRPAIGYDMRFGGIQGYLEAYGDAEKLLVQYEVALTPDGPALLSEVVPGRPAVDDAMIFSRILLTRDLPAGQYILRARLSYGPPSGPPLKQITRPFRVP